MTEGRFCTLLSVLRAAAFNSVCCPGGMPGVAISASLARIVSATHRRTSAVTIQRQR
jgi:hypothetical protein